MKQKRNSRRNSKQSTWCLVLAITVALVMLPVSIFGIFYVSAVILATQNVFALGSLFLSFVLLILVCGLCVVSMAKETIQCP